MMRQAHDFFSGLRESSESEDRRWPPAWLVSFSDMMTLLLTFFIFFFSVTTLKELPNILQHLRDKSGIIVPIEKNEFPVPEKRTLVEKNFIQRDSEVIENFEKYLKAKGLEKDIELKAGEKEIRITIKSPILFSLGKSELKPNALPVLERLTYLFKDSDDYIRVEGHTDNLPINTEKFPSNWELSSARAINVIRYFIDNKDISPTRFEALGYGEFRPTETNDSKEGRAKNRRVEIKIIKK